MGDAWPSRGVTQPRNVKAGCLEGTLLQKSPKDPTGWELPRSSGGGILSRGNTSAKTGSSREFLVPLGQRGRPAGPRASGGPGGGARPPPAPIPWCSGPILQAEDSTVGTGHGRE